MSRKPEEPFGPRYPDLPNLRKHRTAAKKAGGVMKLDRDTRQQYGETVGREILALQRAAVSKAHYGTPRCASGSWANTAEGIEAAVRRRIASALAVAARRDRQGRSDDQVRLLYAEAMEAKRKG